MVRTDIYEGGYAPVGDVYLPLGGRITTTDDSGIVIRLILLADTNRLANAPPNGK